MNGLEYLLQMKDTRNSTYRTLTQKECWACLHRQKVRFQLTSLTIPEYYLITCASDEMKEVELDALPPLVKIAEVDYRTGVLLETMNYGNNGSPRLLSQLAEWLHRGEDKMELSNMLDMALVNDVKEALFGVKDQRWPSTGKFTERLHLRDTKLLIEILVAGLFKRRPNVERRPLLPNSWFAKDLILFKEILKKSMPKLICESLANLNDKHMEFWKSIFGIFPPGPNLLIAFQIQMIPNTCSPFSRKL